MIQSRMTGLTDRPRGPAFRAMRLRWQALPPNLQGASYVLVAAAGITLVWALAKELAGRSIHPFQIALCRSAFSLIFLIPFLLHGRPAKFRTAHPWMHLTRATSGAIAMLLGFYALAHLPLAEVTALSFTTPLFTVLFAAAVLGERVGPRRWGAVAAGFLGMLIIVQPGAGLFRLDAVYAVTAAMLIAFSITLVKRFPASESQSVMLFYAVAASILVCLWPALEVWRDPDPLEWLMLVTVGALALGAHALLIQGFRIGESSFVAPFDYSKLLFALSIGFFAFGELPGLEMLLGAAVLIASSIYIARRETRANRKGSSA